MQGVLGLGGHVRGWASYYRLSDQCVKPLDEGEHIMGARVETPTDRSLVVARKSGEQVECGGGSVQVEKGEHLFLNLTDPPADVSYSEHVLEIEGGGSEFETAGYSKHRWAANGSA